MSQEEGANHPSPHVSNSPTVHIKSSAQYETIPPRENK